MSDFILDLLSLILAVRRFFCLMVPLSDMQRLMDIIMGWPHGKISNTPQIEVYNRRFVDL